MVIFKKLYKAKNSPLNSQSLETTNSRSGAVTNSQMVFWSEFSLLERLCAGSAAQSCLSRLPFPTPGDLPNPGIEPMSPLPPGTIGRRILYHCDTQDPRKTRMILLFHYVFGRCFTVWATREVSSFHYTSTKSSLH